MRGKIVLNQETLDRINTDRKLKSLVADALDMSVNSLYRLVYANDPKLTQAKVMMVLREYLKVKKDTDLLVEIQITAVA